MDCERRDKFEREFRLAAAKVAGMSKRNNLATAIIDDLAPARQSLGATHSNMPGCCQWL
jgi:hypothetical protein